MEKLRNIADVNLICDKIKIYAKEETENNMYAAIALIPFPRRLKFKSEKIKINSGDIWLEINRTSKLMIRG